MANRKQPNVSRVIQYCMWHNSLQYFQSWPITNCKFLPTLLKLYEENIIIDNYYVLYIFWSNQITPWHHYVKMFHHRSLIYTTIYNASGFFFRTWPRQSLSCGRKYKIYNCKWFALAIAQIKENYLIFSSYWCNK